jgi:hypothetical protein
VLGTRFQRKKRTPALEGQINPTKALDIPTFLQFIYNEMMIGQAGIDQCLLIALWPKTGKLRPAFRLYLRPFKLS